jgi:integrase
MESLSTRRRRPLKPANVYGWQHCLDRWILPNLGNMVLSEVRNGALRQFVEILTAARLAPKTIVNVVTVVKFVVASAVDEEGDQIHPRIWNHEFIQLPLVIKENQSRPTVTEAEISGLLNSLKECYAVLVALVAGTGLRMGEALAVRTAMYQRGRRVDDALKIGAWPGAVRTMRAGTHIGIQADDQIHLPPSVCHFC